MIRHPAGVVNAQYAGSRKEESWPPAQLPRIRFDSAACPPPNPPPVVVFDLDCTRDHVILEYRILRELMGKLSLVITNKHTALQSATPDLGMPARYDPFSKILSEGCLRMTS